jgi:antitoxin protein of toxin-antitoxin system
VPPAGVGAPGDAARQKAGPVRDEEARVSEFGDLEKKAEAYVKEHPEQADKGINEVADIADPDPDHQHDEQIDRAVDAAGQHTGQDQDQDQQGG